MDLDEETELIIKVTGTAEQEHHIRLPQSMRDQDGKELHRATSWAHEQEGDDGVARQPQS